MLTAFDPQRRRAAAEFSDRSCRTTKHTPQDSGDHGPARDHRAVSERSARASFISSNAFHSPARQTEERAGARPRRRAWACPGETGSNAASRGHAQAAVDCCPRWLSPTFSSPCPSLSTAGACLELGFPSPSYPVLSPPRFPRELSRVPDRSQSRITRCIEPPVHQVTLRLCDCYYILLTTATPILPG